MITDLTQAETLRFADALAALRDDDWARKTDCTLWTVRDMAGHVLGMTRTFSALPQFVSHMVAGTRAAGERPQIDGLTEVQVKRNESLSTRALVDELRTLAPKNAAWRKSRRLMRRIPMKIDMKGGRETWRLGFLFDTVLTRDTWMHRVDLARAVDQPMTLTADHDGRIVADAVDEWARRHGQAYALRLTGPAGGEFRRGEGGPSIEIDAVEFCRILSGRAEGDGLLNQEVPF
ncbi:MAG: hypothetical protein QOJ00_1717 [Actinomycetota bacterium]|jgi:uncharacterized protein (TIGR03083 family)